MEAVQSNTKKVTLNHEKVVNIYMININIAYEKSKAANISKYKAGANQSNISSNITFLPCWMKCWNGLRNYKIYKVSKKKKKIVLDDVG